MTAANLIAQDRAVVKREIVNAFGAMLDSVFDAAASGALTPAGAEREAWRVMVRLGGMLLTALLTVLCRQASERCVVELGLSLVDARFRMDRDYFATLKSTFGPVRFPWFAFRGEGGRTHVPARELFPLHQMIRVTEPLLEWEAALAADHPFRKAAEALLFFTHGAADVEDNTLERHAVLVGSAIPPEWQYRRPAQIRQLLCERATRDAATGKPLVYASTDAHALRRFVDDSWAAPWKMCNGIRVWCVDAKTEATIHLGGEYTWGDCREVALRFEALRTSGHLPIDGDYGDSVVAQLVLVTDGANWITDHVLPLFPNAVSILDMIHALEHVAEAARKAFPESPSASSAVIERGRRALGMRDPRPRATSRKGPKKRRPALSPPPTNGSAREVGAVLTPLLDKGSKAGKEAAWTALEYVANNQDRMDYGELRARGFHVGSGAMESLHRTASQLRLKRPGCRWTGAVAQSLLNLRMLQLCERWDEFWQDPGLAARVVSAHSLKDVATEAAA